MESITGEYNFISKSPLNLNHKRLSPELGIFNKEIRLNIGPQHNIYWALT